MARANDLTLYERHAADWWDPRSATFRSLHATHRYRAALLHEWLGERLDGSLIADLGCGGGLLAAELARSGARVVGVDVGSRSLAAARRSGAWLVRGDARRAPLASARFDVVLLADVVEHLEDPHRAVAEAARITRPGGRVFVNTLNRTRRAEWLAVRIAEGVRLVPRGTHDPRLFVAPDDLHRYAAEHGLSLERVQGESVDLLRTLRRWAVTLRRSEDLSLGYSALYVKSDATAGSRATRRC